MIFTTYNVSTKHYSTDDFINIIREIVNYTYFDIEYETKVEIKDILDFKKFEYNKKFLLHNRGFYK